ncbi:Alcohol dehydrogenase GroES-like domain protein [Acididesulfobacillus acetoxydans]|uniref:Alcohol dehydrogenase n=1 Tax=Acididesulfobacillus acetoxydans TaxID=1561005 RepID=A0A8S0WI28_9FIRM|nr:alcohol dehydrogenase catalytic domain-containing protein [Acididesulfobacillus acetoxydans]CAA7603072.1 Alcohol dehydrogenase GroES-like domain protein [Acididesulfobacillus acetoxydans]CEJ05690.1 Alcohol dehydrogenase [Acididesulfobacillus acetoxydans]
MLAASFMGEQKIALVDKEIPAIKSDEVLIKVAYTGLCGSDKRLFYLGTPVVPGHEISGTVIQIGVDVNTDIHKGTRVIVYIPLYCNSCNECRLGNYNRCENISGLIGWQVPGGYEEFMAVPAGNVIPIDDDISLDEAVLLLDTIGTPGHGIRMCIKAIGDNVAERALVIGCGPLGLGSLLVLKGMGIKEIYAYDPNVNRLHLALDFGARAYDAERSPEMHIVIEASGQEVARQMALHAVHAGGAVLLLGESSTPWTIVPSPEIRRKDCFYIRSFYFPLKEVKENVSLFKDNRTEFNKLISEVGSLKEIERMHIDFCEGKTIKPLVKLSVD